MRTLVLRVVAEPPQVFWAPLLPAAGNVLINIIAMLFGIMGFNMNLVEFFDNECPYCKKLSPAIEKLVSEDPGVRVILKEFPILGPGSETSARYALAAIGQGKYAQFHSALMDDKTPEHQLAEPHILEIAAKTGLDVERLKKDAAQPAITSRIEANRVLARKLTISGTPGLVVGDKIESGALTIEVLRQAVAEMRKARQPVG